MSNTHGGARPGAGRKPGSVKPDKDKAITKSVCLTPAEWQQLADAAPDGSPNKEAARRLWASLAPSPSAPPLPR